jgi:hypothetical protein
MPQKTTPTAQAKKLANDQSKKTKQTKAVATNKVLPYWRYFRK